MLTIGNLKQCDQPRCPSVKTLEKGLRIPREVAQKLRIELQRYQFINRDEMDRYNRNRAEIVLKNCDTILNNAGFMFFGVEFNRKGKGSKSPAFDYINSGDSYGATIIWIKGQFIVGCWGDIVERGNYE